MRRTVRAAAEPSVRLNERQVFVTKGDHVVAELRAAIRSGELAPGERILMGDWARRLGVSETPMREALRVLSAEGSVVINAHKGAHVTSFSSVDFSEFCRVLGALEGISVQLATEKLTAQERQSVALGLRVILEDLELAIREGELARWITLNRSFHSTFDEVARSSILRLATSPLRDAFPVADRVLGEIVMDSRSAAKELVSEYENIVRFFEAGDASGGSAAMGRHVEWAVAHLRNAKPSEPLDDRRPTARAAE